MAESDTEKLEIIAAECYKEGIKAENNQDILMAIGCFAAAWALGRYTENISLMTFSGNALRKMGLYQKLARECQEDGYKIIANDYVLRCLLRNRMPEIL